MSRPDATGGWVGHSLPKYLLQQRVSYKVTCPINPCIATANLIVLTYVLPYVPYHFIVFPGAIYTCKAIVMIKSPDWLS